MPKKHEPWCESHQWEPEDRAGTCDCGVGGFVTLVEGEKECQYEKSKADTNTVAKEKPTEVKEQKPKLPDKEGQFRLIRRNEY
jgi:hypothetical protein